MKQFPFVKLTDFANKLWCPVSLPTSAFAYQVLDVVLMHRVLHDNFHRSFECANKQFLCISLYMQLQFPLCIFVNRKLQSTGPVHL